LNIIKLKPYMNEINEKGGGGVGGEGGIIFLI
jgi:hypothetical protein